MRTPLSACVTTLNNENTLRACLDSVSWVDEIILLDSGSQDGTVAIARQSGAVIHTQAFAGYGPQKQRAIDLAANDWVLLLDADEVLSEGAREEILHILAEDPPLPAYRLPRREQMFWTWQHSGTRHNDYLRLFDRRRTRMEVEGIHAAPRTAGPTGRLTNVIRHYGEPDIDTKVEKVNRYSSAVAGQKIRNGPHFARTKMVFYPPVAFARAYFFKRLFLNGWAGFISAVVMAFYAFMKYAKLYEHGKHRNDTED